MRAAPGVLCHNGCITGPPQLVAMPAPYNHGASIHMRSGTPYERSGARSQSMGATLCKVSRTRWATIMPDHRTDHIASADRPWWSQQGGDQGTATRATTCFVPGGGAAGQGRAEGRGDLIRAVMMGPVGGSEPENTAHCLKLLWRPADGRCRLPDAEAQPQSSRIEMEIDGLSLAVRTPPPESAHCRPPWPPV